MCQHIEQLSEKALEAQNISLVKLLELTSEPHINTLRRPTVNIKAALNP